MNEHEQERVEQLLKQSLPPISVLAGTETQRDLWPAMLRRLEARPAVPWFDWALLAAVVAWFALFPGTISLLLYHL
jgi:hypothetical protein